MKSDGWRSSASDDGEVTINDLVADTNNLPPDEQEAAAGKIQDLSPERSEVTADRILIYSADGDAFLERVHEAGLKPITELVRRSSLEDVFLRLTGRTLVD